MHQDEIEIDFIKKNKYVLIGLISVLGIYLTWERIPGLDPHYSNLFSGSAGWLIFTALLGICLLKLYLDRDFYIIEKKE